VQRNYLEDMSTHMHYKVTLFCTGRKLQRVK